MKKLIFLLLVIVNLQAFSQSSVKVDHALRISIPTFTATKDTSWVQELSSSYYYSYAPKWVDLDATDSYLSVYLGYDPDGDGMWDWVLESTLDSDSLQLTPLSGFSLFSKLPNFTDAGAIKLNYNHGTVSSGTINFELNLTTVR